MESEHFLCQRMSPFAGFWYAMDPRVLVVTVIVQSGVW